MCIRDRSFIPEALPKLSEARRRIQAAKRDIRLEIDGGVKVDNVAAIARAGADTFVCLLYTSRCV